MGTVMNPPGGIVPWPSLARQGPSGSAMMPFGMAKQEQETEMSDQEQKALTDQMRAAAKRTQTILDEENHRHQDAHIDSMKTTDAHVGKASGEPHKPQSEEDAKVDKASITGDPHVKSAPLKTHGETTDEVTTEPEGARPGGGGGQLGPRPQDMVRRAQAAAAGDPTGGDPRAAKSKKSGKRGK